MNSIIPTDISPIGSAPPEELDDELEEELEELDDELVELEEEELDEEELEELDDELELLLDELVSPPELEPPLLPPLPPQALIAADKSVTAPSCKPRVATLSNSKAIIDFSQCKIAPIFLIVLPALPVYQTSGFRLIGRF